MLRSFAIAAGCALAAFLWPLVFIDRAAGNDWAYFDSLSMVVRSSALSYGRFPLHDPWIVGGFDMLSNPQTRIFSPFGLLDLVFVPNTANVVSLVIYGVFGALGMMRLLEHFGHQRALSAAGALMFVSGSWFMLHYAEGHIPYGSMLLLPWVVLAFLRFDEPHMLVRIAALFALFIVDGGIYTLTFSLYALVAMTVLQLVPWRGWFAAVWSRKALLPTLLVSAAAVVATKLLPVFATFGSFGKRFEETHLSAANAAHALFGPWQYYGDTPPGSPWRFHELGCYLGFAALAVIVVALRDAGYRKRYLRWFIFAAIFLWIGSNFLSPFNPWLLAAVTPLLQQAHVQSRLFVLMWLAWVILTCGALQTLVRYRTLAMVAVVGEIVLVSQIGWYAALHEHASGRVPALTSRLITRRSWARTHYRCEKPDLYLLEGVGCYDTYEPALPVREVRYQTQSGYAGEISVVRGEGTAELIEVSPGQIAFSFRGNGPARVRINQNRNFGWETVLGDAAPVQRGYALLVDVAHEDDIVLHYHPWYWPYLAWVYCAGVLGLLICIVKVRE